MRTLRRAWIRGCAVLVVGLAVAWAAHGLRKGPLGGRPGTDERMRLGERIYREGILPSGRLLRGRRAGGADVLGAQAACVQCHRRSGMGMVEGTRIIPPIAGPFLFQPRAQSFAELDGRHTRGPDLAHAIGRDRARPPYTNKTLGRAICDGIDASGGSLEAWMPRYDLDAAEVELLVDYLRLLSDRWSQGVTRDRLHFATVVTPGVDRRRARALVDVLAAFFAVHNAGNRLERLRDRPYLPSGPRTYRSWELHVWELRGPPESWGAQLAGYEQRQPVFALLSGISDGAWAPVREFCEERRVPCWFPTVDLPVTSDTDSYSVYFSKGVMLEAELLAHRLAELAPVAGRRVIEIRRDDVAAAGAARSLLRALRQPTIGVEERVLPELDAARLRAAIADATSADTLVLWLRDSDVAQLAKVPAPRAEAYFSATLTGGEQDSIPPAWKERARLLYPFELPRQRDFSMSRFHSWLKTRGLELVDERVQAEAYLASVLMSEKVDEMLEYLYRDYLMERAEAILSMHLSTVLYHRLSLGPAQRFASKGGYIARFATRDGRALAAEGDWIVP
jgi:hypothetical protein